MGKGEMTLTTTSSKKMKKKDGKGRDIVVGEETTAGWQAKKLTDWSVDEVGLFLQSISLNQYKDVFFFNEVDGEMLSTVDEEDLLVLPIERMGHRKKILRKVASLMGDNSDEDLSESITTESPPTLATETETDNIPLSSPPSTPHTVLGGKGGAEELCGKEMDESILRHDILTLEETARYMRLSPNEIRSFISTKGGRGLPAVKTSDGYRIHKKAIQKFMMQE